MKNLITAAVAAFGIAASAVSATAADWTPPGPIKLMIAFAAGGGADTQARLIAEEMEARTGWQFIPEQVCPSSYKVGHQIGLSTGGSGSFV